MHDTKVVVMQSQEFQKLSTCHIQYNTKLSKHKALRLAGSEFELTILSMTPH